MDRIYSSSIKPEDDGKKVRVAGWVEDIRNLGGIAFIQLRDRDGRLQIAVFKKSQKDIFDTLTTIPRESVVEVEGTVKRNAIAPNGIELLPLNVNVLSKSKSPLPMGVVDKVSVEMDTRLNTRFIDLRREEVSAVFKIRSTLLSGIRDVLEGESFIEIHTPKIVATATEGGTALFQIKYFDVLAYLNQSPQLYKQMLMSTGMDRVYEIAPAFRAEEHDTVRHLNEFISIDIEMAFADEEDVMGVLERVIAGGIEKVIKRNKKELETLNVILNSVSIPFKRITYDEGIEIALKNNVSVKWGEDLSLESLKAIGSEMPDFYFIKYWPTDIKPFYAQPLQDRTEVSRTFDLMYREKEITSGAQRVNNLSLLKKRLESQGLKPENFKFYLDAFEYGMPPHAGWGLGIERLTMVITERSNIRECVLFPRDRRRLVP